MKTKLREDVIIMVVTGLIVLAAFLFTLRAMPQEICLLGSFGELECVHEIL